MGTKERYDAWLRDFEGDPDMMEDLRSIAGDAEAIEDRFYTSLSFGTAGMRGRLGAGTNRMNRYTVRRATAGLADYINGIDGAAARGVIIAYDSRRMSPEFAEEAALVLAGRGVRVQLFPSLRPVPVLSFSVRHLDAASGIVITASHNPRDFNGYKVYWEDGAQISPDRAKAIEALIGAYGYTDVQPMARDEALAKGLLHYVDSAVDDAYIAHVKSLAIQPGLLKAHGKDLTIVYSPVHGSGYVPVKRVLTEMGVTNLIIVPEQRDPDPAFPTVEEPNPEERGTMAMAIALAKERGADVCFATDPDCDRLGVAMRDKDGEFILLTGNQIGCLLLHYILDSRREMGTLPKDGAAIKSIVSTALADHIAEGYGAAMIQTLTGFKFIAEQIEAFERTGSHTFLFGFEESYGYLSSTYVRDKDAVNASLLVTELSLSLKLQGMTLCDRLEQIYAQFGHIVEKNGKVRFPGKEGADRMAAIMDALRAPDTRPKAIGGMRIAEIRDYKTGLSTDGHGENARPMGFPEQSDVLYYVLERPDCWACVRPSGTEAMIKTYVGTRGASTAEAEALAMALITAMEAMLA